MSYKPRLIANAFLLKASSYRRSLSHLQLQKLVYFAHAWHLAIHKEPLIKMRVKPRPSGRGRKARSDIENVAAMAD